jgi:lactose/L-arabinose transport system permease protein
MIKKIIPSRLISSTIIWLFLIIGACFSIFPFYWMIIGATQNPNDVIRGVLIPGNEFFINLKKITQTYNVALFFFNSLKIALIYVVCGLIVNSLAGYGFAKYKSKARDRMFGILMLALILPQIAIVMPMFRMIAAFKMLDSHWSIIFPYLMSVFIIFFMRQNFSMFPTEIIEAARIDGASEFSIFMRVVVPSMKACFSSAAIYLFIFQWGSYLWPLMTILSEGKKTLPIAISSIMRAYTIEYGGLMIIICISIFPVMAFFLIMQKQFVAGLLGSIKQ